MTHIYLIRNNINNKIYIGQTRRSVHTRFLEHGRDVKSSLYADMCKYGRESFTYEILHICNDEYAEQWERYYICKYNATDTNVGYNIVLGGSYHWVVGGYNPSKTPQGRERIKQRNLANLENVTKGLRKSNNDKKFPVAMVDADGNILQCFDSLLNACNYLGKPSCGTTRIKQVCGKFNKNGKRAKFFGHYWIALNKDVQTNTEDVCKAEDELPSE